MIHLQYLRKSRDRREREDPDVLRRHRTILLELARSDGAVLRSEHCFEEVKSGEHISARPEFQQLLEVVRALPDCPSDRAQGVLYCIDADRLARGILTERGEVQELLIRKGILIRTPSGLSDLRNPDERLLHNVKGALAEWELGKYRERVARTRALQVRQGQVRNGSVPFGYVWDHQSKQPKPDPERFPILQVLCREAFYTSLEVLAERHKVYPQRILRTLRSPMICGWPAKTTQIVKTEKGTTICRIAPREDWVWPEQPGSYPAAISREDWERLQVVISRRAWQYRGKSHAADSWCRDVVQFVEMPGRARLGSYQSPSTRFDSYERRIKRGPRLYVRRSDVHTEVMKCLLPVLTHAGLFAQIQQWRQHREQKLSPDEAALKQRQYRLREQLKRLDRMESDPDTDPQRIPGIRELRVDVLRDVHDVSSQLEQRRARVPALSHVEMEKLSHLAAEMQREQMFEDVWEAQQEGVKRAVVRAVVEEVEVTIIKRQGPHQRLIVVRLQPWAQALVRKG